MMGRVCPAPCQTGCNRNEVEDYRRHQRGRAVHRRLRAGQELRVRRPGLKPASASRSWAAARPGSRPRISCAARGTPSRCSTITPNSGGMAKYGVPGYRLPRTHLDGEINRIIAMGVEVRLNTRVGRDIALERPRSGLRRRAAHDRLQGRPRPAGSGGRRAQLHQRRRVPGGVQPGSPANRSPGGWWWSAAAIPRSTWCRSRVAWATSRT